MTDESEEVRAHREENMNGEVDDQPIVRGWSITVRELKQAIAGIPDDYEVMLENAEVDECDISNVNINYLYPPALGSPGLLVLGGGQILNSEYGYHERMDAHHIIGGDQTWNTEKGWSAGSGGWAEPPALA